MGICWKRRGREGAREARVTGLREGPVRGAWLAGAAAAATGVQVGAAMVATRFVIGETTPAALAMMRYLVGFLCLLPVVMLLPPVRFAGRDVLPLALLGTLQFGVLIALLNFGLQHVSAGRGALVFATLPLLAMLTAAALGRERLTAAKLLGVLATVLGVALVLGEDAWSGKAGAHEWLGVLAVFLSAVCGALCSVLYRPYLERYPALPVSAFAMLAAVGLLAVAAAGEGFFGAAPAISPAGWAAVGFIGISSGIGYFLWLWALGHTTPTRVTVFLGLSPVTAALLGAPLLGEPVSMTLALGVASVVAGLWIAHRPEPARSPGGPRARGPAASATSAVAGSRRSSRPRRRPC